MEDSAQGPTPIETQNPPVKKTRLDLILIAFLSICIVFLGTYIFIRDRYTEPASSTRDISVEKIRVGNVGEYTIFNLIAAEKGYFKENGLDASIKEYTSGPASIAGLHAGEVDVTIAADFVGVRNLFNYPQMRILAQVNQHRVFQLATKKDGPIKNPIDLKGKKIGITKNSAGEFFLGNFLTFNELKLEEVTMVDLTPADMVTQLEEGKIDGIVVFEPHIYRLKNKLGDNFKSWDIQGNQNLNAILWSTQDYLSQNPEIIKRYMQALVKAEKYYQDNPQEVKTFISKKLGQETAYIDYAASKFTHAITLQQELLINMESQARWVIKNGLTDKKEVPNYLEYMNFEVLQQAKPEAVTVIR